MQLFTFIAFILLSFYIEVLFKLELGLMAHKQDCISVFALTLFSCLEIPSEYGYV